MIPKIIFFLCLVFLVSCADSERDSETDRANISPFMNSNENDQAGFKKVSGVREFRFPEDHAAHPDYQTEWWYITGNLEAQNQRRFGFQMTIFRRAIDPKRPKIESKWATNQIYMAHFSISDIQNKKFHSFERFSRDTLSLAGVETQPFKVWLLDWEIKSEQDEFFPLTLTAKDKSDDTWVEINLNMNSSKPLVLQGDKGFSRKSSETDSASYYYSYTRLNSTGTISINNDTFKVSGNAWMDREWSTSALDESTTGWDWFSLQLSNDEEIMFYQLRKKNGDMGRASAGSYISKQGKVTKLKYDQVNIEKLATWKSSSGVTYPSAWKLSIPDEKISLNIEPYMNNQEINFSVRYWEGAVKIKGTVAEKQVTGSGYVELSGYTLGMGTE